MNYLVWNTDIFVSSGLSMPQRKFLNASSVGNVSREAALYPHTYWYIVIPGPTLVSNVERDFTRNQIWRSTHISTQVRSVSGQSWLLKYSWLKHVLPSQQSHGTWFYTHFDRKYFYTFVQYILQISWGILNIKGKGYISHTFLHFWCCF